LWGCRMSRGRVATRGPRSSTYKTRLQWRTWRRPAQHAARRRWRPGPAARGQAQQGGARKGRQARSGGLHLRQQHASIFCQRRTLQVQPATPTQAHRCGSGLRAPGTASPPPQCGPHCLHLASIHPHPPPHQRRPRCRCPAVPLPACPP
jgi:hypothetical protein